MSNQKDPKDFLCDGERLDDLQRDGMYYSESEVVRLLHGCCPFIRIRKGKGRGKMFGPWLWQRHYSVTAFRRTKGSSFTGLELQKILPKWRNAVWRITKKKIKCILCRGISGKLLQFLKLLPLTLLRVIRRI